MTFFSSVSLSSVLFRVSRVFFGLAVGRQIKPSLLFLKAAKGIQTSHGAALASAAARDARTQGGRIASLFGRLRTLRIAVCAAAIAVAGAFWLPVAAQADHQYLESFGPDGTEATDFGDSVGSRSVAVDQGNTTIYVFDRAAEAIFKFDENHQPANFSGLVSSNKIAGLPSNSCAGCSQLAVDATTHRIYATSGATLNSLRAFEASGLPATFSSLGSSEITGFSELCGVAVDSNGDIYAGDAATNKVSVYAPSGAALTSFSASPEPCNLAVDGAGQVYVNHWSSSVEKFTPSVFPVTPLTTYASVTTVDPGPDRSLAVNAVSGHLYVLRAVGAFSGSNAESEVIEYEASGTKVPPPFGSSEPGKLFESAGIAVRGSGTAERIYASDLRGRKRVEIFGPSEVLPEPETLAASAVAKTSASLNGRVNPKGAPLTVCKFKYIDNTGYEAALKAAAPNPYASGDEVPCQSVDGNPIPPAEVPADSSSHTVSAQPTGLAVNTEYHYRFVAGNEAGSVSGADKTFVTLGPPVIEAESASAITATSARISGTIDPRGEATTFAVKYVSAAQFAVSGYERATTTPFKAVGPGIGAVPVSMEVAGLAPGTVYHYRLLAQNLSDLVVEGEEPEPFTTFPSSAATLPDRRRYEMVSPAFKAGEVFPPETNGRLSGSCAGCLPGTLLLKMPMKPAPDGDAIVFEGQAFGPGTAAEANEYLANRGPGGWVTEGISKPNYLTTSDFEEQGSGYQAFSDDLSRGVIFQVSPPLSPQAPTGFSDLYLWQQGGALTPLITHQLLHREPNAGPNSLLLVYAGANVGTPSADAFTHVIFEANDALTGEVPGVAPQAPEVLPSERNLYEWARGQLRLVNVLPGNAAAASNAVLGSGLLISVGLEKEGPDFNHAISDDGSRIFWTAKSSGKVYLRQNGTKTAEIPDSGAFLTASTNGSRLLLSNGHLYNTIPTVPNQIADLTAGQGGFEGTLGTSEDLSRIYFVDNKVLAKQNSEHKSPSLGKDNLYFWEDGTIIFIATLSGGDNFIGGAELVGDWRPSPSFRTAQVSPSGRYVAFMSEARLTGYDSNQRDGKGCLRGSGPTACTEVFEFDAESARLVCVSCNPSGERPRGYSNLSLVSFGRRATFITEPRNLTSEGRLFFESQDTLTTNDTNGHIQDVYEWEPIGVGDCEKAAGCLALISSGHSANDSQFLGATPTGDDAFIVTRERLLPRDQDDLLDLYDARVEGGFPEEGQAACAGEGCRGPLALPLASPSPGSPGFSGPGNPPPPCRAGYVRKQGKCVKQHKHKKKPKKQKRHARGGAK